MFSHYRGLIIEGEKSGYLFQYASFNIIQYARNILNKKSLKLCNEIRCLTRLRSYDKIIFAGKPATLYTLIVSMICPQESIHHTSEVNYRFQKLKKKILFYLQLKICIRRRHRIAFVTNYAKSKFLDASGWSVNNRVISEAVYHSLLPSDTGKKIPGTPLTPVRLLFVGRLVDEKQPEIAIKIFKNICKQKNCSLTIVGEGKLKDYLVKKNLENVNIKFAGALSPEKLRKEYRRSHFLILPSKATPYWREFFGMVLIEAMSEGCIPISTPEPGPKEILSGTGLILDNCGFEDSGTRLILKLLNDENRMKDKQKHCLALSRKYRPQAIFHLWEKLI